MDYAYRAHGLAPVATTRRPRRGCRLKPTSPCHGKASDGGDVGVRYTPEMIEIVKKALELRKKGIIKF